MDATIALSDIYTEISVSSPPVTMAPQVPPNSMWAPVGESQQTVAGQVAAAAEALNARVAAAAVETAREAVEFGHQKGISVPSRIAQRAGVGRDG
ncbi:hypothetical protein [Mycobacterium arosiense]|nr:hypothetical protein [Mycobacterium arosiense]